MISERSFDGEDHVGYDCPTCTESRSLEKRLSKFDWKPYEQHLLTKGQSVPFPANLTSKYLDVLVPWIEHVPAAVATQLKAPHVEVNCTDPQFQAALTGKPRGTPARILDFTSFGFELDLLEIRLHELDGLVETHVIAESTRTHRFAEKPLFLKRNMARFSDFRDRIVDLILDDEESDAQLAKSQPKVSAKGLPEDWRMEVFIRKWMWQRYVKDHGEPNPNDLLIHGDLDEIPSRKVVAHLKYCELKPEFSEVTVVSDWYRMNFDWVINQTPKLWYPKVFRAEIVSKKNGFVRGSLEPRPTHMFGGGHLNRFGSPALLLYKHLAIAEGGSPPRGSIDFMKNPNKLLPLIAQGQRECCEDPPRMVKPRKDEFIPWFADANWQRYPHLFPSRAAQH